MEKMRSIEMALKNEETEMKFYLNEAERSKNPTAKNIFTLIAKDEEEHMARIKSLYEKLVSEKKWPEDIPIDVKGTNVRETLGNLVKNAGKEEHNKDDIDALKEAIEFEKNGAKFYSDLASKCKNPMEINFFTFLAGIEKEHSLALSDTLLYLEDPDSWFLEHEHSSLDGG